MLSFEEIIYRLQKFWREQGCATLQPYDLEMGAGTFHPYTVLKTLKLPRWWVSFVQPSRRPGDSRYGRHPNRLQHYYQLQVILKPAPENIQQLYLESLKAIGLDYKKEDIRFIEDDWESPTLGASGVGWEVQCNGMEVSQFTYMQQIGGIECDTVAGEITYGLERLALYIQNKDKIEDLIWHATSEHTLTYGEVDFAAEEEFSKYNLELADTDVLKRHFTEYEEAAHFNAEHNLPVVAYEFCIKASHVFNILDARGVISVQERAAYISKVRALAKLACTKWLEKK